MEGIDDEMEMAKEFVVKEDNEENSLSEVPVDPNLVCPLCLRQFKLGEIQKYRRHVNKCPGKS